MNDSPARAPTVHADTEVGPELTHRWGRNSPAKPSASCVEAEVLMTDQSWVPVTVLAWHRLAEPFEQVITQQTITWLVQLRLDDSSEAWYEFVDLNLRPRLATMTAQPRRRSLPALVYHPLTLFIPDH
jgi:hypothetical protein